MPPDDPGRGGDGTGPTDTDPAGLHPDSDRVLLDVMLGKLAVYLRMCAYDAAYAGDRGVEADAAVRRLALSENRRLLTRDVDLAAATDDAILLMERDVADQLAELAAAGATLEVADEPVRCGHCNGALAAIEADGETPEYAPDPAETDCWRCRDCGRAFWKGSHWDRVAATVESL